MVRMRLSGNGGVTEKPRTLLQLPTMAADADIMSNLGEVATILSMDIEAVMHSLYALRQSLTNTRGRDQKLRQRSEYRWQSLQASWGWILSFLKDSYAFGSDVITLSELIKTVPAESCQESLETLSVSSMELHEGATTLISMNQKNVGELENQKKQWSIASERSSSGVEVHSGKWMTDAFGMWQSRARIGRETLATPASSSTGLAYPAAYSESLKHLAEMQQALTRVQSDLNTICQFWLSTSEICQKLARKSDITITQVEILAVAWRTHQRGLGVAIKSVAESCKTIAVKPKRQLRQQGRYGFGVLLLITGIMFVMWLAAQVLEKKGIKVSSARVNMGRYW